MFELIMKIFNRIRNIILINIRIQLKNARYYTLIAYNDNDSDENQFKIQIHLQASTQYVMRIITFNQNIDGNYTIVASGLTPINIEKIADSLFPILNHSPCGG
ncbi:unnamed protein product [Adineta ricciae]|uniref:Uncharacterized protein n=1 Tax=Adineta ricciae TaxID=249248 RepID=A0A815JLQ4_ADIRI|nr:unnamed protein product [Adineta ricciae]